jgi:hypothetical protein
MTESLSNAEQQESEVSELRTDQDLPKGLRPVHHVAIEEKDIELSGLRPEHGLIIL